MAFHITNLPFDFSPVIRALTRELAKQALWIRDFSYPEKGDSHSDWVLVTSNQTFLEDPFVNSRIVPWSTLEGTVWTDDCSNLFQVVAP